jgi:ribosome-associated protein
MSQDLLIRNSLILPAGELRCRFSRSSGPGGQNVNKVESKVEVAFDVGSSPSLTDRQRAQIRHALAGRIDAEGVLRVVVQDSRSQWANREAAREKLAALLRAALTPRKRRIATGPSKGSKERRFRTKKHRADIKKNRRADLE